MTEGYWRLLPKRKKNGQFVATRRKKRSKKRR